MNWRALAEGLLSAALGGAATGGMAALQDGPFNAKQVASSAIVGALVAIAAYLKQSPIKPKPKAASDEPPPDPGPQG